MRYLLCMLLSLAGSAALADVVFEGKDGQVVIESESTTSPLGKWVKKTSVDGYTGECHYEFTGNTPNNGPATSPLTYTFTVDKEGPYRLWIRAHKRLLGDDGKKARGDQCNDCYVRLEGNFESGNEAPRKVLGTDTKLYVHGKSAESWDWTAKLDFHDPETHAGVKRDAVYELKTGEVYTLVVSGRSQRFNMDRILFKHESVDTREAQDPETPESQAR